MDIYRQKLLKIVFMTVLFVIGVALQIIGQRIKGFEGLSLQLISLVILLFDLYIYNRQFR